MTDLNFSDALHKNPFIRSNYYYYDQVIETKLKFFVGTENLPYIMSNGYHSGRMILNISTYNNQLEGRLLNITRLKEVMDSARIPLLLNIKQKDYLVGKGFLAHVTNKEQIGEAFKVLFAACYKGIIG